MVNVPGSSKSSQSAASAPVVLQNGPAGPPSLPASSFGGFCFGGGIVNAMAVRFPDLAAGVPYYGSQPSAADAAKIKAPLLIHYASEDERVNAGWPAYESALKANGVRYEMHMYPNAQHAFHNDTTPRYDEAAAKLAWQRTADFFNKHLRT